MIHIDGLFVPGPVRIGPVTLETATDVVERLSLADAELARDQVQYLIDEHEISTTAQVTTRDQEKAFDLTGQAIDLLRVFQHCRHHRYSPPLFCMAGELGRGDLRYAWTEEGGCGQGGALRAEPFGWEMPSVEEWEKAKPFAWCASSIGSERTTAAQRRAMVGVQLLSQAIAENRGTFKMVTLVTALEALLLEQQTYGQSFRLARHVSYFGCGNHSNDLCGRSRETCPFLALDPASPGNRKKLTRWRELGKNPPLYCAEWHRVVDWYDNRSAVVHGAELSTSFESAKTALYWALRNIIESVLTWLATEPTDPIPELIGAINSLPPPPDWEARLGVSLHA